MYKRKQASKTSLQVNNAITGETIEKKVRRITQNKEPITDGAPIIFTERREGVNPAYDIRTDKWEIALDAMDKVNRTELARREDRIKTREGSKETGEQAREGMKKEGGTQSIQGTSE